MGFRLGPLLALLICSLCLAPGRLAAADATAGRPIPLFFQGGILACQGSVDGIPGVLIVDSGSNTTCLFARQTKSRRYRYAPVQTTCFTAGGTRQVTSAVQSARFTVGGQRYTAKNLMILPDPPKVGSRNVIGLLGCDFLTRKRMLIDLVGMRLIPQP